MDANLKEGYLGVLDGIRGFLAFWVFFSHLQMACVGKPPFWGRGAIAVDIFMLLSGFLMAYHWQLRRERFCAFRHQVFDFYIRRFFRIAPLYYILLTVAFLGHEHFFQMRDYIKHVVPPPWAANIQAGNVHELRISNILAHYSFLFGFIPKYASSTILRDWSIGLEMQFYLIFPFLILLIYRYGPFSIILLLAFISFLTNKTVGLYLSHGLFGRFPQPSFIFFKVNIFASGISIAYLYFNRKNAKGIPWAILTSISLYNAAPQVWLAALLIVFMLVFDNEKTELIGNLLSNRIGKFLGDTSYSVYLVHPMIFLPTLYLLYQEQWFIILNPYARLSIAFPLTAIPVYLIAYALFRIIELRGIKLGRNILQRTI